METLQYLVVFLITLGILVTVHEYGHFWVARRCGVKVLRFSFGFGKPLFSWYGKDGTEYVISPLPLGGYVKLLDDRAEPVPDDQYHLSLNAKPVTQRIAIYAAGPGINFLFAILALWLFYAMGVAGVKPVLGVIEADSPAAKAGLASEQIILAIDGYETKTAEAVQLRLLDRLGETGVIQFTVTDATIMTEMAEIQAKGEIKSIPIERWLKNEDEPRIFAALGLDFYSLPFRLGEVREGGAGHRAGLQQGDQILAVDGKPVGSWGRWVQMIEASPERDMVVIIERAGREQTLILRPDLKIEENGREIGFLNVRIDQNWQRWPEAYLVRYNVIESLGAAFKGTWDFIMFTFASLKKMVVGEISTKNLGGPIAIAEVANTSFEIGIEAYLHLLAILSISLGVINLLPIPILDGGHILFYLIELVKGKPISEANLHRSMAFGFAILVGLMVFAFANDICRAWGFCI